jgi:hypothetical protein
MILLQDNAQPHKKATVVSYLEKKGVILLKQPAYSPDFNLMDCFVFTHLTTQPCGILEDKLKSQFQHLQEDLCRKTSNLPMFTFYSVFLGLVCTAVYELMG